MLTGSGRAPKSQMQMAIQRELGLAATPEPADVADALAIALCHFYMTKTGALVNQSLDRPQAAPARPVVDMAQLKAQARESRNNP